MEKIGHLVFRLPNGRRRPSKMHVQPDSLFLWPLVNNPGWKTDSRSFSAAREAAGGLPSSFGDVNPEFMRWA